MKQRVKLKVVKLSNFINRNTGFLIVLVIIVVGLAVLDFQKDNQLILKDTHDAVKNTKLLLDQREAERMERDTSVQKVIEANTRSDEQQTMILCTLILRGNVEVTPSEAIEIEKICEAEIQRFQDRGGQLQMSEMPEQPGEPSPSNGQSSGQQSNNQPPPSTSPSITPPTQNPPPSQSPPEDRTTIGGFLADVEETITNLSCGALGVFC